jgi:hypothetical protein
MLLHLYCVVSTAVDDATRVSKKRRIASYISLTNNDDMHYSNDGDSSADEDNNTKGECCDSTALQSQTSSTCS